jgi:uncharacterized protein YidB (DUF937 family)
MSLLDTLKSLSGSPSTGSSYPAQCLLPHVLEMFGQGGGLNSLVRSFEESGLGNIVNSWISSGQNMPISPGQVESGLGSETISQLAERCGLPAEAVTSQLSQMLPALVDSLTPNSHTRDATDLVSRGKELLGSLLTRQSGA